jgi:hypothetical protein
MPEDTKNSKLHVIQQMLESAEASLQAAKQSLAELTGVKSDAAPTADFTKKAETLTVDEGGRVIEGVFDGKDMVGPDKRKYPVPANYASKSKLVAGDVLKLTVTEDGSYIYKQIGPVARRKMIGTLTQEGNQYQVLAGGKPYNVLLASVTYFKAQPGNQVSIILPEKEDADWAAVDNLIVKPDGSGEAVEVPEEEPAPAGDKAAK